MSKTHIAAVVVTYDRRDLLMEALTAVHDQVRSPDTVIVVDNASSDGTAAAVRRRFASVELVTLPRNTGGAGGFAVGIERALAGGADLVWLMDDDTVPSPAALSELIAARDRHPGATAPTLVASRVIWTDGRDHPLNTPRPRPGAPKSAMAAGCVPIRSASFVSVLIDAAAIRERGLPIADYFLWNDDFEFTTRLLRDRVGLLCPSSVVVHKTAALDPDPGDRFFYEVRNKVWLFTRSDGLTFGERILYSGSTARRWARTIARSHDRPSLIRHLARGISAGMRTRPRPTEAFLAELENH